MVSFLEDWQSTATRDIRRPERRIVVKVVTSKPYPISDILGTAPSKEDSR